MKFKFWRLYIRFRQWLNPSYEAYPCRCGKVHTGDYAIYDYGNHMCYHDEPLSMVCDDNPGYLICGQCGQIFWEQLASEQHCPKCRTNPCQCSGEKYVPPELPYTIKTQ